MGDLYVHRQMKPCCRTALGKLDKVCATVSGKSKTCDRICLVTTLGDLPIPVATSFVDNQNIVAQITSHFSNKSLTESLSAEGFKKFNDICQKHEQDHRSASEHREAAFWAALRGNISWLPNHVPVGTETYYGDRHKDFKEKRHPDLPAPTYYIDYGKYYYDVFQKLKPQLSENGKQWVDKVARLLQEKMESKIGETLATKIEFDALERDDKLFFRFAYSTHCEAYVEAGLWDLPREDRAKIATAPTWWNSYLDRDWWPQAICSGLKDPAAALATTPGVIGEEAKTGAKAVGGAVQDVVNDIGSKGGAVLQQLEQYIFNQDPFSQK
ncbi:MAG: hypothetical protein HUU21_12475 [Polyangiaceae bacterium]|nr:hypothetical protein [Polyangiaceae bacterium]